MMSLMWDPAGRPRKTHGTSAQRRAQTVTEWTNTGLFLGGRLRSSIYCPQMGVPFWVRYEDRLFRSGMKSRSRFAALWNGYGQRSFIKFLYSLQSKTPKETRAVLTETFGNMQHYTPPSKTGWPSLRVVIFPPVFRLVLDDPKHILLIKFAS